MDSVEEKHMQINLLRRQTESLETISKTLKEILQFIDDTWGYHNPYVDQFRAEEASQTKNPE